LKLLVDGYWGNMYYKSATINYKITSEESANELQSVAGPLQTLPAIEATH
jgi:hypothetical protein